MSLFLLLAACSPFPDQVQLEGKVLDDRSAQGAPVPGAEITSRTIEADVFDQATAQSDGSFKITVPANHSFFLSLDGDGFVNTSFTGLSAAEDIEVDDGTLWLRAEDDLQAIRDEFVDCANAQEAGAVVEGVVRLYIPNQDPEQLPPVTTATVSAWTEDGAEYPGCYLPSPDSEDDDEEGDTGAADLPETGDTGRFAVFGVPSGPISVLVSYRATDDLTIESWSFYWLAKNGTAPLYPAYVEPPG